MKRIDLDDLPPKLAALLTAAGAGEEVLLVQGGAVVGRLTGGGPQPHSLGVGPTEDNPEMPAEERAREIFEQFRASIEDEF
jgi:antitoxin (DNA-binding transcriptional repressor) of toxin-antitoxin stability system